MKRGKDDGVAYEGRGRRREWKEEEEEGAGKVGKVMGWEGGIEERGERAFYTFCEEE
jgi:hypothetical protein